MKVSLILWCLQILCTYSIVQFTYCLLAGTTDLITLGTGYYYFTELLMFLDSSLTLEGSQLMNFVWCWRQCMNFLLAKKRLVESKIQIQNCTFLYILVPYSFILLVTKTWKNLVLSFSIIHKLPISVYHLVSLRKKKETSLFYVYLKKAVEWISKDIVVTISARERMNSLEQILK